MPLNWRKNPETCFITPFSRYRYRRAPQGQSGSGDAYTNRADEITKIVKRQCKVVDDALLYDNEGNFYHTFAYLKLCEDNGITFNKEKFQFCEMEVEFTYFRVTKDGVKPSHQILDDIINFPGTRNPQGGKAMVWHCGIILLHR